jgi:hypothetical protein
MKKIDPFITDESRDRLKVDIVLFELGLCIAFVLSSQLLLDRITVIIIIFIIIIFCCSETACDELTLSLNKLKMTP